jgi:AraC-like DNA-binding protein
MYGDSLPERDLGIHLPVLTVLTDGFPDFAGMGDLPPGKRLSLPVQIGGRLARLVVAVQGLEELPPAPATQQLTPQQFHQACDAMREGLAEPVRLATVASLVGLSPWHFSRSFHASAGVRFTVYLLGLRLECAMRMMLETNRSLCDIALACGFGDQSNFSRVFVSSQGITPSRWRRLTILWSTVNDASHHLTQSVRGRTRHH